MHPEGTIYLFSLIVVYWLVNKSNTFIQLNVILLNMLKYYLIWMILIVNLQCALITKFKSLIAGYEMEGIHAFSLRLLWGLGLIGTKLLPRSTQGKMLKIIFSNYYLICYLQYNYSSWKENFVYFCAFYSTFLVCVVKEMLSLWLNNLFSGTFLIADQRPWNKVNI